MLHVGTLGHASANKDMGHTITNIPAYIDNAPMNILNRQSIRLGLSTAELLTNAFSLTADILIRLY